VSFLYPGILFCVLRLNLFWTRFSLDTPIFFSISLRLLFLSFFLKYWLPPPSFSSNARDKQSVVALPCPPQITLFCLHWARLAFSGDPPSQLFPLFKVRWLSAKFFLSPFFFPSFVFHPTLFRFSGSPSRCSAPR